MKQSKKKPAKPRSVAALTAIRKKAGPHKPKFYKCEYCSDSGLVWSFINIENEDEAMYTYVPCPKCSGE